MNNTAATILDLPITLSAISIDMGEVSSESGTPYAITVNQDAISLTYSGTTISPAEFDFEPIYLLRDSDSGQEVTTYLSFDSAT